ncbi:phage tail tube protein [Lactococcus lactis]|uniref:phage tail tube protein n=1 Tax=Lactococcus lactis TaxID=1358 RepID=UPI00241678F5|nr:Ig-like domain-containing protein [Lactococcus lactis]MDG4958551.1 Ig-like domain-containing protein [Lactococcus lactis]
MTYTGFALNYLNKYEIGEAGIVDPSTGKITPPDKLYELAEGIQSVDLKNDEDSSDYSYYADRGGKETNISTVSTSYAFKGHRRYAEDDAQAFIRERLAKTGQDRVVYFKHTEPDGRILSGNATLSGIVHGGGDAGERGNFESTITFNGLPDDSKSNTVEVTSVTLNKTTTSIAAGANETLTASVLPADATDKTITFTTSDEQIATVTSAGKVTGIKAGTATINASSKNGKTASCTVTVTGA